MKTMQDYTTRCTEEQTIRAYKLGAPIESSYGDYSTLPFQEKYAQNGKIYNEDGGYDDILLEVPTTQQMIGWLRKEKGLSINGLYYGCENEPQTYEEAELAAINAALEYLESPTYIDAALDYLKSPTYLLGKLNKCADAILDKLEKEGTK